MPDEPSEIIARIDGASRGNPGPAAYAVVIESADGTVLESFSQCLGQTTNNLAEYQGLLAALRYAVEKQYRRLSLFSDSELLVRQIEGQYKVRHPDLKPLHQRAIDLIAQLDSFKIRHVPREQNREADRLANHALDGKEKTLHHEGTRTQRNDSQSEAGGGAAVAPREPIRTAGTYRRRSIEFREELPLQEGEEVELEIRPRKPRPD